MVKKVIKQHSFTPRFSTGPVKVCAPGGVGQGDDCPLNIRRQREQYLPPCGCVGHTLPPPPQHTHPRYSLRGQNGSQERRGCRPLLQLLPAIFSLCPIPLRPSHDTIALSFPSPSQSLVWPQRGPHTPQWPGHEDPASPRLPPRRGPGFRRTARKT